MNWCRLALVAALLLSGLAASAPAPGAESARKASEAVVKVVFNKKLKRKIVVTGGGRTLYVFTADLHGTSVCTGEGSPPCTKLWPPLGSLGSPRAGRGINATKLDSFTRADGKVQVRYYKHPLYTFHGGFGTAGDKKPGQIRGQGYFQSWYVLSPKGRAILKG